MRSRQCESCCCLQDEGHPVSAAGVRAGEALLLSDEDLRLDDTKCEGVLIHR